MRSHHFITREIDTVAVKGKVDGIKIFELIAARMSVHGSHSFRAEVPKEHPTFQTRVSQLPQATAIQPFLGQFDVALNNYRAQKLTRRSLASRNRRCSARPSSKVFIGRCNEYKVDPPEANKDGVQAEVKIVGESSFS